MIASVTTEKLTETFQRQQIINAATYILSEGIFKSNEDFNVFEGAIASASTKEQIYVAWQHLKSGRYRQRLRKVGIEFPTEMPKPLNVTPVSADAWLVENPIKGSSYYVSINGFSLVCECEAAAHGSYCSHMQAVDKIREPSVVASFEGQGLTEVEETSDQLQRSGDIPLAGVTSADDEPYEPVSTELTAVEFKLLPGVTPTTDQLKAFNKVAHWWLETEEPFFRLSGYAGTGKTTWIQGFIRWLRDRDRVTRIVFTAPTNKAVKVLSRMVNRWGLDIECMTCARLLAIRERKYGDKQVFERDYDADPAIDDQDLIVVDERSMIGTDLAEYLVEESTRQYPRRHRFIVMGDLAQLPPVNEAHPYPFTEAGHHHADLTEVVRYGGPIGELATMLRTNQISLDPIAVTPHTDEGKGVFALGRSEWESKLVKAFTSDKFKVDSDFVRVLAYRNKRCSYLNQLIRTSLHGANVAEYVEGERIIAKQPYLEGRTVLMPNSAEGNVLSVSSGTLGHWGIWFLTVHVEGQGIQTLPVLRQSEKARFDQYLEGLRKSKQWGAYWGLKESFAWVDYAYALTVHKSQGSTFTNVFVDLKDINSNKRFNITHDRRRIYERWQLGYVACTRATDRVIVYQ